MTKEQSQFRGEKTVFQQTMLEHYLKVNNYRYRTYTFFKKINSKSFIDLNMKGKAIEDNIGEYLGDRFGDDF